MASVFSNMVTNSTRANIPEGSSLGLSKDEVRTLDAVRNRLYRLSRSIESLKNDIYQNHPLPSPQSLQTNARILKQDLSYLLDILNENSALFQRIVIHPSTNYPGRSEHASSILGQLLRKKLEPEVEALVEVARDEALAAGILPTTSFLSMEQMAREKQARREQDGLRMTNLDEDEEDDEGESDEDEENAVNEPIGVGDVWADSRAWCQQRLKEWVAEDFSDPYTAEERELGIEKVRTGLRQSLEEDDDDDEEDEDGDEDEEGDMTMGGVAPIAPSSGAPAGQPGGGGPGREVKTVGPSPGEDPERMLWFVARCNDVLPNYIELEAQRLARETQEGKRGRGR